VRSEPVEIYSDASNAAVMRHPERRFPGVLVQGDTLYGLCQTLDVVCEEAQGTLSEDGYAKLNAARNHLWSLMLHYKGVLAEHHLPLPFVETARK
jgi:hypothetical protein